MCLVEFLSSFRYREQAPQYLPNSVFRFGSLFARLSTDDAEFRARFLRVFHDCLAVPGAPHVPIVSMDVTGSSIDDPVTADISDHDGPFAAVFLPKLFPELNMVVADCSTVDGWQLLARSTEPRRPVLATGQDRIVIDRNEPWQRIAANYFLAHVMRQQPEVAFFHGATLAVGNCGVLLSGDKGSGKSTLSLALAARGNAFLGDEIAAIHSSTRALVPFLRAVSIRPGPQAKAVQRFLEDNQVDRETLPNGTDRMRTPISRIFPDAAPRAVRLTHAFFLEGMSQSARAKAFDFSPHDSPLLAPLHASVVGRSASERALTFVRLFGQAQCYMLTPGGTPDQTAELIQKIVEGRWDTPSEKEPSASAPIVG